MADWSGGVLAERKEKWEKKKRERERRKERKRKEKNESFRMKSRIYSTSKFFVKVSILISKSYNHLKVDSI